MNRLTETQKFNKEMLMKSQQLNEMNHRGKKDYFEEHVHGH